MFSTIKKVFPNKLKAALKVLLPSSGWEVERKRLLNMPRYTDGISNFMGKPIHFSDSLSFLAAYEEIFLQQVYSFRPGTETPFIIDAGSNIGLSILYLKARYRGAVIIGIEPDPHIFKLLQKNMACYGIKGVTLIEAALWKDSGNMTFASDKAMSGSLKTIEGASGTLVVKTIKLSSLIDQSVDLLKIDIEGAEVECLEEAYDTLSKVKNIFVEYHADKDRPQQLHKLLRLLNSAGFRYYIREAFCSPQPFMETSFMGNNDLQLNIFGIR